MADEASGRGVGAGRQRAAREGRPEPLGKRLAKLHPPLVEGVDAPEDPLDEDPVLVEGDQPAEGPGVEPVVHDGRRRPIPGGAPVGGESLGVGAGNPGRLQLAPRFIRGAAEGERLPLREAARDEEAVMVAAGSVPGLGGDDELHRHHVGPLVEELEE